MTPRRAPMAFVMLGILAAACGFPASPATSPAPTAGTTAATSPSPAATAPPASMPGTSPVAGRILDCGGAGPPVDFATCLRALGAAAQATGDVGERAQRITVSFTNPLESERRQLVSETVGTATIEAFGRMPAEWLVLIEGNGITAPIRVYDGLGELGIGAAPRQVREYDVVGNLDAWTDEGTFELEAVTFDVDAHCGGQPGAPAQGTVILEQLMPEGPPEEVYRLTCGPVEGLNVQSGFVTPEAGTFRVRLVSILGNLGVTIWPRATWR